MMSNAAIMAFAAFQDACLTHYGGEVENQMEMIKEFGIKIVRTCGVWGSTLALAKLAAGSIAALLMTPADSLVAADAGAEFAKNSAESLVPPDAEELFYESDPEPVKKRPAMKRPAASPAASAAPSAAADAAKPEDKHAAEPEATCDADEPAGESSAAPSKKAKTLFPNADYTYTDKSEAQVAVVVDTFAEARERDVLNLAEEMERNHENDKKFLQKVFERIDEDGSGELTLEELSRLRVMDIDEVDLQQLFEMIDVDGSGSIEAHEFIAPLSRWVHESKTAPRFIKYNMLRSMQQQDELYRQSWYQFNALSTKLEERDIGAGMHGEMSSPEEASPNHRSSRRSSRPSRMSDRTASLDEVEGMMSPQEKAEDVASEHPEGPAEQPQASSLMFDWRPGPRPARNRLGSEEGHFVRKHSLEQIHENQRSSSASTGPGASAVGTLEMSELSAAFQSNSRLLKASRALANMSMADLAEASADAAQQAAVASGRLGAAEALALAQQAEAAARQLANCQLPGLLDELLCLATCAAEGSLMVLALGVAKLEPGSIVASVAVSGAASDEESDHLVQRRTSTTLAPSTSTTGTNTSLATSTLTSVSNESNESEPQWQPQYSVVPEEDPDSVKVYIFSILGVMAFVAAMVLLTWWCARGLLQPSALRHCLGRCATEDSSDFGGVLPVHREAWVEAAMGCCKSRRRWLEPTVDYDPDFREQAKVVGHTYHCPHGHLMEKLVTHKAGYLRCDVCGRPQGVGRRMQGCWDCDYHVCQSCEKQFEDKEWYASWFKFWHGDAQVSPEVEECSAASTVTPRKVPKCPRQHTLCEYFKPEEPELDRAVANSTPSINLSPSDAPFPRSPPYSAMFAESVWRRMSGFGAAQNDPPMPAPPEPPSSQLSSLNSSPKVTRIKPQQLDVTQELLQKDKESKKAMVLGGRCEVVAPALMPLGTS
eukprot:g11550.t1